MPRPSTLRSRRTESSSAYAFGRNVRFLTPEEAAKATPEDRLRSVWPFCVRQCSAFHGRLKQSEKVAFDLDDILNDVAAEILEKDRSWDKDRGRYSAFVGPIIRNKLLAIREAARPVSSPKNSSCRVKEYQREEEQGTLSPERRKTWGDILRTFGESEGEESAHQQFIEGGSVLDSVVEVELDEEQTQQLCRMIMRLTALEALVVGKLFGLWGQAPARPSEILGPDRAREVSSLKISAFRKLRAMISEE